MDKIHIYRNDARTFGGRTNKYLTRIGRICGGQDGVSIPPRFFFIFHDPTASFKCMYLFRIPKNIAILSTMDLTS